MSIKKWAGTGDWQPIVNKKTGKESPLVRAGSRGIVMHFTVAAQSDAFDAENEAKRARTPEAKQKAATSLIEAAKRLRAAAERSAKEGRTEKEGQRLVKRAERCEAEATRLGSKS